jgi:sugar phosphate isomerase/epimerase
MDLQIGLQLYSVRNELQRDALAALEKVAAIGYKNLELITTVTDRGLLFGEKTLPSEFRKYLDRLDLKAVGAHVMLQEGMNLDRVIDALTEVGVSSLVIPFALFDSRQSVMSLCKQLNQFAEVCKKKSIQLYYHNHFQEFQKFDDRMVMDFMLENTDRDLVMFEFDTYWAIRGGQDPIAWIRKFGKRCDLLHQKDLPEGVRPVNLFDLSIQNQDMKLMDMFKTISPEQFTEIGAGIINIPEIIEAGRTYGNARYIIVEQDMTSKTELDSITISYKKLIRLLDGG